MQTPMYVMRQQPVQKPNIIMTGSPVVSPAEVFPERYGYGLPPMAVLPPPPLPLFHPFPPRPFGYPYYGPYGYGYGYGVPFY